MTAGTSPRRLRADAARNRQLLIDAAEKLFAECGLGVTLDDIAAEAGVNVATAYRHFANKHELAAAFVQQSIDRAVDIAERAAAAPDPWTGLAEFLADALALMAANRGLIDVITHAYGTGWFDSVHQRMNPPITRLLARGQDAGVVRRDVTAEDFGVILPMLSTATDLDDGRLAARYLALVLAGLRPSEIALPGAPPSFEQTRAATTGPAARAARKRV